MKHAIRMRAAFRTTILTLFATTLALGFMLPLLWLLGGALRPGDEIFQSLTPITLESFISPHLTLHNFSAVLEGPFRQGLQNSLIVAIGTVALSLTACALAAFALAAMPLPHRNGIFALVIFTFLIPSEVIALPLSRLFAHWGLQNTYMGLILPGLGDGIAIFLLRQFFLAIPRELIDAARIDGASWLSIFSRVFVPLSKPVLASAALLIFTGQWQAYLWPLLITTQPDRYLAPITLAELFGQYDSDFGQIFAAATILSLIPATLLLGFQGFFTQSVARTGIRD